MVGRTLSAVTLHEPGRALTDNYLNVELSALREPNSLVNVRIAAISRNGICEMRLLKCTITTHKE